METQAQPLRAVGSQAGGGSRAGGAGRDTEAAGCALSSVSGSECGPRGTVPFGNSAQPLCAVGSQAGGGSRAGSAGGTQRLPGARRALFSGLSAGRVEPFRLGTRAVSSSRAETTATIAASPGPRTALLGTFFIQQINKLACRGVSGS